MCDSIFNLLNLMYARWHGREKRRGGGKGTAPFEEEEYPSEAEEEVEAVLGTEVG